ncbi:MAG: hypothetical protein IT437_03060 [Phycisphaerales bacterium]|nr:hypothetical protein [Phycisphaerales bacterium]
MAAFELVERWARDWRIGERDGLDTPGHPGGVSVVLRLDGKIVGRGTDVSGSADTLRIAAGSALAEAAARVPVEHDALMEQSRRSIAERITISLELAGPMIPFSPAEYADAAKDIAPGIDGVACRFGGGVAAMFPMQMLISGMDGARGLSAAVAKAAGEPAKGLVKPADLARDDHAVFYRFKTVHLAQLAPRGTPTFLDRGGRVIAPGEVTTAELRRWADGLAGNLARRMYPGPEKYGIQGTYDPLTGEYQAPFASPEEQVAAWLALSSYADIAKDQALAAAAGDAMAGVQAALLTAEPGEAPPWHDAAVAPAAWAFEQMRVKTGSPAALSDEMSLKARTATADVVSDDGQFAAAIPPGERPFALYMLVLASEAMPPDGADARALEKDLSAGLDRLYRDTPPGGLVGQMPWMGYAEVVRSREGPIAAAVALRDMRDLVWKNQLQADALPYSERDLAGGIVFTASRSPNPSWQAARPLAFIAMMLGDPRLTEPREMMPELTRLTVSLRFLRQLTAGPAECHMYADPGRAMWGVRASLWDQSMPVDATAVTLMAVCDTLRSLDALRHRETVPVK